MTGKTKTGVVIEPNGASEPSPAERSTQSAATAALMNQHSAPTAQPADELAHLRAEEKALKARLKELRATAKANRPAKVARTLASVEAEQRGQFGNGELRRLARRVVARERVGQPRAEAIAAVLEQRATALAEALALWDQDASRPFAAAVAEWVAAHAPASTPNDD